MDRDRFDPRAGKFRVLRKASQDSPDYIGESDSGEQARIVVLRLQDHHYYLPEREVRDFVARTMPPPLEHPNAQRTLEQGTTADGAHFVALELVEGKDLAQILNEGPLPPARALEIALPVCDVLQAAHDRGILHGDLSPANVVVLENGLVKVLAFGVASWREGLADLGCVSVICGFPGVMSPERIRAMPAVPASDIYSLGVLLFWMQAGTPPFTGTFIDVLRGHMLKSPPRLDAPHGAVIARALAKDPADRFPSMRALGEALRSALG